MESWLQVSIKVTHEAVEAVADLLRDAGVDMATPQPLLDTLRVVEETLDAFEKLAAQN